jgi:hypothetical protein
MRQIFLDCDGVLADFDSAARALFGQHPREAEKSLGTEEFWRRIRGQKNFYRHLALMADAMQLYNSVAHLKPIILTGCPHGGWAEPQKKAWAREHFPGVKMITCRSKEKFLHLEKPGDILVDDYFKYREFWVNAGGIFIQHVSAADSIRQLAANGVEVRA